MKILLVLLMMINTPNVLGRIQIRICGSSTVYPFALELARHFSKKTQYVSPVVVSTGSTAGLKEFAKGVGGFTVDIANASRPIKDEEIRTCHKNGIHHIGEFVIGYDGLVLGVSKKTHDMKEVKLSDMLLAVADKVPGQGGQPIDNPYKLWSDINPTYPKKPIRILIPSMKHGTRDAFDSLVMSPTLLGKTDFKEIKVRQGEEVREITDYESADEDCLLFRYMVDHPDTIAVFGYNLLERNASNIKALSVDGSLPTVDEIQKGKYPLSRKLYFYVKCDNESYVEGLPEYIHEWLSDDAVGDDGYLTKMGLIPCLKGAVQWRDVG